MHYLSCYYRKNKATQHISIKGESFDENIFRQVYLEAKITNIVYLVYKLYSCDPFCPKPQIRDPLGWTGVQ